MSGTNRPSSQGPRSRLRRPRLSRAPCYAVGQAPKIRPGFCESRLVPAENGVGRLSAADRLFELSEDSSATPPFS